MVSTSYSDVTINSTNFVKSTNVEDLLLKEDEDELLLEDDATYILLEVIHSSISTDYSKTMVTY